MSYLIRTGNSRNNISWGGGTSTKAKYLRRTGTGRTSISWIDINSNSTVNVLERTSSGRNNIRWYNTTFSFASWSTLKELLDSVKIQIRYLNTDNGYRFNGHISPMDLIRFYNDYLTTQENIYSTGIEVTSNRYNKLFLNIYKGSDDIYQSIYNQMSVLKHISFLRRKMRGKYEFYTNISVTDIIYQDTSGYNFTISFASCDFKVEEGIGWQFGFKMDP